MSTTPREPTPQAKRQRVEDVELEPGPIQVIEITRSPDLWFDDGNIVLQAEKTQFRVHRTNVSVHSTFFNNMFLIPQPEGQAQVDGCPLIVLPDDAKAWSDLLMAVYNIFKISPNPNDYPVSRVISLLRLGHKYQFDYFRNIAASRIKSQLPSSSLEWHMRSLRTPLDAQKNTSQDPVVAMKGHAFDLVNVALEVGMQTILPVAYLMCLHNWTLDDILDGIEREDGTRVHLSVPAQRTLISAQVEIAQLAMLHIELEPLMQLQEAYRDESVVCEAGDALSDSGPCSARTAESHEWLLRLSSEPEIGLDLSRPGGLEVMCAPCSDFVRFRIHRGQDKFWNAFPVAFGLPKFSDLKDLYEYV